VSRELPRIKREIASYTSAVYQQAPPAVREQFELSLNRQIDALTHLALQLVPALKSEDLQKQTRACKVWPEVLDTLMKARARYRGFTGKDSPGAEIMDGLKAIMATRDASNR
jgi:hypothetical protein